MRPTLHVALVVFLCATLLAVAASAQTASPADSKSGAYALITGPDGEIKAPLFSEKYAQTKVAQVEDRILTLQDLADALASSHLARGPESKSDKKDFTPVLDRLIGTQLIALEAHEMGIDELPEVKAAVEKFADSTLREELKSRVTKGLKPDPAEVQRLYREAIREWKIKSVLFVAEADARAFSLSLATGKRFDEAAQQAIAAKKATGGEAGQYVSAKSKEFLPQILATARALLPGHASAAIQVPNGWTVIGLEDIRYPEDAQAHAEAEQASVERQGEDALKKFYAGLMKHVHIDQKRFARLDFEKKKPGFATLAKDQRVLARIEGGQPITVADLAKELQLNFFHGIDAAIAEKKLKDQTLPLFNALLYKRVFTAEARREDVAAGSEYKKLVADYRDSVVFGVFVQRAVLPDLKVMEDEGKKYYEAHKSEYSYPEFFSLYSLGFATEAEARAAKSKLEAGTDFKWLKATAQGQIKEADRAVDFDGSTMSAKALAPALAAALKGTRSGALRLYAAEGGQHYVILVKQETPPLPQPYLQSREAIAKKLSAEKLSKALEEWVAKLRKAHVVKVFVTKIVS